MRDIVFIALTFLAAMVLAILPLPDWAVYARPQWVFLVLLFWVAVVPMRVGIGIAWIVGLLMDLLTGSLLGQHAFIYSLTAYLVIKFHPQLRNFPIWQQTGMVFLLAMLNLAIQYGVVMAIGSAPVEWSFWLSAMTSCIIWPWLYWLLQDYQW